MARIRCILLAIVFLSSVISISSIAVIEDSDHLVARTMQSSYTIDINVTVVDNVGRAISGATVHIRDNTSTWQTNEFGYWNITGLADDVTEYTLYADKGGYLIDADVVLPVAANNSYNVTLKIIGGTILGTVKSQTGFIMGANVSVSDPVLFLSANVDSVNGTYYVYGVPGGTRLVTANAPGYASSSKTVGINAGGAALADFVLTPLPGTISGFVFEEATHAPLVNVTVSVTLLDRTTTVQTIGDGSYLIPDLPEGTYVVVASKEGYYPVTLGGIVVTKENMTENVNFTLAEKPISLYGTVKSGTLLLRLVNVSVIGTELFNISDAGGTYRIENITAGTYNISAAREGYVTAIIVDVVIPTGGTVELDIDLVALPGAVLIGTVVDKDSPDKVLYNVIVTIFISSTQQRTELTDPLGHFGFTELAAGNYTLQLEAPGYQPLEVRNVAVKENETTNVTFKMQPLRGGFEGFIFGFDLAHSMMILALFITIVILAIAVYLRYRTFQAPETAPAVYDQEEDTEKEIKESAGEPEVEKEKKDEI